MLLLVGLGNPGGQYARQRHNIGFMAVDAIADALDFGPERSRFQGIAREGRIGTEKALALKPQTYMNESGRSVAEAARFYKLDAEDILVFHDELDLAPGKIRLKQGGGHAGHNGLRSIHAHVGAEYRRARLGIGHPGDKSRVSGYVLHDFAKADRDWLDPLLEEVSRHAPLIATEGDKKFHQAVTQALAPPNAPKKDKPAKTPDTGGGDEKSSETLQETPFSALKRLLRRE